MLAAWPYLRALPLLRRNKMDQGPTTAFSAWWKSRLVAWKLISAELCWIHQKREAEGKDGQGRLTEGLLAQMAGQRAHSPNGRSSVLSPHCGQGGIWGGVGMARLGRAGWLPSSDTWSIRHTQALLCGRPGRHPSPHHCVLCNLKFPDPNRIPSLLRAEFCVLSCNYLYADILAKQAALRHPRLLETGNGPAWGTRTEEAEERKGQERWVYKARKWGKEMYTWPSWKEARNDLATKPAQPWQDLFDSGQLQPGNTHSQRQKITARQ